MKQVGRGRAFVASVMVGSCAPGAAATEDGDLPVLVRSGVKTHASLQALAQRPLHLDVGGCLRIEGGPFVIWLYDSRISRTAEGLQVIDGLFRCGECGRGRPSERHQGANALGLR